MTLLIVGGALYAVLMLFMLGAMYVSGRGSDAEESFESFELARMQKARAAEDKLAFAFIPHKDAA
ncbi:hypothetical protein [Phytohalomonas tamaricis]|uniref:hypothetical protein n=1 Tax=Phytohalomonas tamaricis TaxID=2081032 RepID=UPI000D0B4E77|nr:hypothetical protein [Phytohalomonas tamaricis]